MSGSHIKIADPLGNSNERLVTITGTPESNQMALYLLYARLESEKGRLNMRWRGFVFVGFPPLKIQFFLLLFFLFVYIDWSIDICIFQNHWRTLAIILLNCSNFVHFSIVDIPIILWDVAVVYYRLIIVQSLPVVIKLHQRVWASNRWQVYLINRINFRSLAYAQTDFCNWSSSSFGRSDNYPSDCIRKVVVLLNLQCTFPSSSSR